MVKVLATRLRPDAVLPRRMTKEAAGFDLTAADDVVVRNTNVDKNATIVHTGISLRIPAGYVGKIFLRSSTGLYTKLRLANGTGIIDSDYHDEILLLVENHARAPQAIHKGDRIAQILFEKVEDVEVECDLPTTEADESKSEGKPHKGFGSTGRKAKNDK